MIGDGDADRRLAERLDASFLDVADELRAYYESRAGELDELALTYEHPEPYKRFFYGARFRAVLDALDPQAGEEILEVGCGSGAYTRELVERGARRHGHGGRARAARAGPPQPRPSRRRRPTSGSRTRSASLFPTSSSTRCS